MRKRLLTMTALLAHVHTFVPHFHLLTCLSYRPPWTVSYGEENRPSILMYWLIHIPACRFPLVGDACAAPRSIQHALCPAPPGRRFHETMSQVNSFVAQEGEE